MTITIVIAQHNVYRKTQC